MKFFVLVLLFACVCAAPQRFTMPLLPLKVMMNGHYQLIPSNKILSGVEVVPNSLPFQVSLQRRGLTGLYSQWCGGSILDASTILDAAHCVEGVDIDSLLVVAGEHSLSLQSGLEQFRSVSRVIIHPLWENVTFENDISLIFLTEPLDLSVPSAQPTNLPPPISEFDPPVGTILSVAGWGSTTLGGSISDVLLTANTSVVTDEYCDSVYGGTASAPAVFPSMLCAGDVPNARIDYCVGDSGGPVYTGIGETAIQHGIISWGQGCAPAARPSVYTQLSYFLDWIAANRI